MPTRKRYSRDRETMRRDILQAARSLFVREGYEHVSMRRIGERIGYSAAAIYLYFPAKEDIFFALAEEGFDRFRELLGDQRDADDLMAALEDRFWRYYQFSRTQPEFFWLMFVDRSVPRIARDWQRAAVVQEASADSVDLVQRCIAAGLFPRGTSPAAASGVLETAVHGAAVRRLSGRSGGKEDADVSARNALRAAIAGLRAGVALDAPTRRPVPRTPGSLP